MPEITRPFAIVVAVDGSELSETVLEHALAEARRRPAHELHVLRVLDVGHKGHRDLDRSGDLDALHQELEREIEYAVTNLSGSPEEIAGWRIRSHVIAGVPDEEIAELAADVRADLIVVGRHGDRGRRHLSIGSVPERLLRQARCPVLVIQPPDYGEPDEAMAESCSACAEARRETDGETWFCAEHAGDWPWRSSFWRPHVETLPTRTGSLWF